MSEGSQYIGLTVEQLEEKVKQQADGDPVSINDLLRRPEVVVAVDPSGPDADKTEAWAHVLDATPRPHAGPYHGLKRPVAPKAGTPQKFVPAQLRKAASIYEERNKLYGDNYKRFGPVLSLILAGQQLDPSDTHQMSRLGIFVQIVAKLTRYGENFTRGGHDDSLDDTAVYAMMLKELDNDAE